MAVNNQEIARRLLNHARELHADLGSLYEMRAYRQAAETMLRLEEPAEQLVALGGRKQRNRCRGLALTSPTPSRGSSGPANSHAPTLALPATDASFPCGSTFLS